MKRAITVFGAPSSIGIRPYDDGTPRRLDLAPAALREQNLVARLAARDAGDVLPTAYRDFERGDKRVRNEEGVVAYSHALAERTAAILQDGDFPLVLGGDCSIVLGCLLGARRAGRAPVGLVYIDAHGDFATPEESRTGSAASMCLALAVGRGDSPLARLEGAEPLVRMDDVAIIGRRDDDEPYYGQAVLTASPILDLNRAALRQAGVQAAAKAALERLSRPALAGFWIHVDADVIDPADVSAVDSPEPDGIRIDELAELLAPLVAHPRALGLELTIYDPALDPDRTSASRLAGLLERVAGPPMT